jgi:hypothetical protein
VTAVDMNTVNDAGTSSTPTELDASNDTTPAFILANAGEDTSTSTTNPLAAPNIRLTLSAATGYGPTTSTVPGDMTATSDGNLWFTHFISSEPAGSQNVPAPVHTEANSNVFAPLDSPSRILDTRSATLRASVLNPSALASNGQLPSKATIYVSLDSVTTFAQALIANVTVTQTTSAGFLTVWSGYISGATSPTAPPSASNINWDGSGVTIANLTAAGVGVYPPGQYTDPATGGDNVIAIYADTTTHVIVDVIAIVTAGYEYVNFSAGPNQATANSVRLTRLARAQAKLRDAKLNGTSKS